MRNYFKINSLFLFAIASIVFLFTMCDDDVIQHGEPLIYMAQATASGGLENTYFVPDGGGEFTYNFKYNNGKLDIILGVFRSGTEPNKDFTVDVIVLDDATSEFVESGEVKNAMIMPSSIYELPSKVTVINSNWASFYLSVDMIELINDASYKRKNLVLVIGIANPTEYKLSDKDISTTVVLDVDALINHFYDEN